MTEITTRSDAVRSTDTSDGAGGRRRRSPKRYLLPVAVVVVAVVEWLGHQVYPPPVGPLREEHVADASAELRQSSPVLLDELVVHLRGLDPLHR